MPAKYQGLSLLFLTTLIFIFSSQTFGAYPDLCDSKTVATQIDLNVGDLLNANLQDCVQYFKLSLSGYLYKYVTFEITFPSLGNDDEFWPFLVQKNTRTPNLFFDSSKTLRRNVTNEDFNGLVNWKDYHNIILYVNDSTPSEVFYGLYNINIDNAPSGLTTPYNIKVISSDDYPCQRGCFEHANHGTCNHEAKKCECYTDYYDLDCSVKAHRIFLDEEYSMAIEPTSYIYFYFPVTRFKNELKMSFEIDKGQADFSFLFNKQGFYNLSNSVVSNGKYRLSPRGLKGEMMVEKDDINQHEGKTLMLGIFNNENEAMNIQLKFRDYENHSTMREISINVALGISISLFIIWMIFSFIRHKYHIQIETFLRNYRVEREEEHILTKKDINKYFPKSRYRDLKSSFSQAMCSVCLEDFESDSQCRQMYCEHIYHSDCIEAWFTKHYNCPNCKKSMTRASIEEFLKEKSKKDENKSLLQKNEENKEAREDQNSEIDNKSPTIISPQPMLLRNNPRESWTPRGSNRNSERDSAQSEVLKLNLEDHPEVRIQNRGEESESGLSTDKKKIDLEVDTKSNHMSQPSSLLDDPNSRGQIRRNPNHNSIKNLKASSSVEKGIVGINLG